MPNTQQVPNNDHANNANNSANNQPNDNQVPNTDVPETGQTIVGAIPMRSLVQNISGRALTLAGSDGSTITLPANFLGNIDEIYLVDFISTELRVLSNVQPAARRYPERNYRIESGDRLTLCNADNNQTIAFQAGNDYTITIPTGIVPGTKIKLLNLSQSTTAMQFDSLVQLVGSHSFSNPNKRSINLTRYQTVELTWTDVDQLMLSTI